MSRLSRAAIIAVGSELLTPSRLDTNSLFITEQLNRVGVEVRYKSIIGDDRGELAHAIARARERVDLVVCCGGLGPTDDDLTRVVVADLLDRSLHEDIAITDRIRIVPGGEPIHYPDFMFQYREAANFPWRSQAAWLYAQMTRWDDRSFSAEEATAAAGTLFSVTFSLTAGEARGSGHRDTGGAGKYRGGLCAEVALTLGGVSLAFAALGHIIGAMSFSFIGALPQRVYGVMTNEVLLAIPLFVFMGVMLERS